MTLKIIQSPLKHDQAPTTSIRSSFSGGPQSFLRLCFHSPRSTKDLLLFHSSSPLSTSLRTNTLPVITFFRVILPLGVGREVAIGRRRGGVKGRGGCACVRRIVRRAAVPAVVRRVRVPSVPHPVTCRQNNIDYQTVRLLNNNRTRHNHTQIQGKDC